MQRRGTLFVRSFPRKIIHDRLYLLKLICYVHQNPVEAGFAESLSDWKYSSYNAMMSQRPIFILREEVIQLFGDLENFRYCQNKSVDIPC
jgi:hypothetical protein